MPKSPTSKIEKPVSRVQQVRSNPRIVEGKTLNPPIGAAESLASSMVDEIALFWRDITREMRAAFRESDFTAAMDASVTTAARVRFQALREKWTIRFNKLAKSSVEQMIERVDRSSIVNLNQSLRQIGENLSISTAYSDKRLQDVMSASTQEAAQLIKRIPAMYLDQVQGEVMRSITSGRGMQDLVPFLSEKYKGNIKWARHVAMDQVNKSYAAINEVRLRKFGVEEYKWIHSGGSKHPRKEHIAMSGNIYRYDDPPVIDSKTGARGGPGTAIFCHPGHSNVEFTNGINKLFRRRYVGELSMIVTDSDSVLESTPNHPILTSIGWKAAKDVEVGDYVIQAFDKSLNAVENDIAKSPSMIGDLFDAALLCFAGSDSHRGGSELEFHGDVSDGEIDVIDVDSYLPVEIDIAFAQRLCEFVLAWADEHAVFDLCHRLSAPDETLMRALCSDQRGVRGMCAALSLLRCHSGHADDIGFTLASYLHASFQQSQTDTRSADIESLGKLKLAEPPDIEGNNLRIGELFALASLAGSLGDGKSLSSDELAECISRNIEMDGRLLKSQTGLEKFERVKSHVRKEFDVHVYNLETKKNWFSTGGLIVHNCRCKAKPVFRFNEEN